MNDIILYSSIFIEFLPVLGFPLHLAGKAILISPSTVIPYLYYLVFRRFLMNLIPLTMHETSKLNGGTRLI